MGFPSGVTLVTLTGNNLLDLEGNPVVSGVVRFKASGQLADPTHGFIVVNIELAATVFDGVMTPVELPVNDASVNPNGFTIAVRQEFYYAMEDGSTSKTPVLDIYNISLDSSLLPSVDLSEIAPVSTFTPVTGITVTGTGTQGQVLTNLGNQTAGWSSPSGGITPPAGDLGGTQQAPTVTGTHLTDPLPLGQGGTGLAPGSVAALFSGLSPITALGDLIYGSGPAASSRLPGSTAAAKKFLTQTGDGTNSAAPGWNSILPGDLPQATLTAFGAVQFDPTVSHLNPNGVASLGTTGLVPDMGHTHPLPGEVFTPYAYGAKGDGKISNTGATTAGSNAASIGEAVLSSADIGKIVMIKNAYNANNAAGITTAVGIIQTVPTSTTFTATWTTGNPTQTSTGLQVLWATDDTTAIQNCINAAFAYAQSHYWYCEVLFKPQNGLYFGVGGALQTTNGGNVLYNAQLTIPLNAETNNGLTIVFRGQGGGQTRYWNADSPNWSGGIQSFGVFTTASAQTTNINAGGNPAVIGCPTGKFNYGVLQGANTTPTYSNVKVVFQDLTILTTHCNSGWTYSTGNFFGAARFAAHNFTYGTNGTVQFYKYTPNLGDFTNVTLLSGGLSIGLLLPSNGNNADTQLDNVVCNGGYTFGLLMTEHARFSGTMLYCWSGICPTGNYGDSASSGTISALHAMYFDQACIESCTYHLNIFGAGQSGIGPIIFGSLDEEGTFQIRDNPNTGAGLAAARGRIYLKGSNGVVTVATGTGAGGLGTGLQIIKEQNLPGVWSGAPALTINTVAFNTYWRPVTLVWAAGGGTGITTIQVSTLASNLTTVPLSTFADFTAAGAIPAGFSVRLGPGQAIKINGTTLPAAAPVWVAD